MTGIHLFFDKIFLGPGRHIRCATLLLALVFAAPLAANHKVIKNDLKNPAAEIHIDHWAGMDIQDQANLLKVQTKLDAASLVFIAAEDGTLVADYTVDIILRNENGEAVAEKLAKRQFRVKTHAETLDGGSQLSEIQFDGLAAGSYNAQVLITDGYSKQEARMELPLVVADMQAGDFSLSDIQLSKQEVVVNPVDPDGTLTTILPHPSGIYGLGATQLYYYFELYAAQESAADSVNFQVACLHPDMTLSVLNAGKLKLSAGKNPVFRSMDTSELASGNYRLLVEVWKTREERTRIREKAFTVFQNPVDLRFRPYDAVLAELRLIAENDELKALKNTPESLRQQALFDFWLQRDPTPSTVHNELMSEFYRRVEVAQKHYYSGSESKGWITDQGKVFIIYGSPDSIVRQGGNLMHAQVEVWQYSHPELNVVFVDNSGFGTYRLIQPFALLD